GGAMVEGSTARDGAPGPLWQPQGRGFALLLPLLAPSPPNRSTGHKPVLSPWRQEFVPVFCRLLEYLKRRTGTVLIGYQPANPVGALGVLDRRFYLAPFDRSSHVRIGSLPLYFAVL